jgi:uncharacterized iron-regulated membrane protein
MPSAADSTEARLALHRWLWRWHGYAGLFVIPFIFFMALTGLPHVWEHEIEDVWHPEYRALTPQDTRVPYAQQLITARAVYPDKPLLLIIVDRDPRHATRFQFGTAVNPYSVFVSPYDGRVITAMSEWIRLSSAGIMLHGLTFIEPYGSWILELLACWGIVLCLTGVYLWWPRGKEKVFGVFIPRLRRDGRTRWRDFHAVTGFYFAVVLALYLATGLPWTAFWGGKLMTSMQNATGQGYPANMTAESGLKSTPPSPDAKPLPLDAFVEFGLKQNLPGRLEIDLPAENTGTVHLRNRLRRDPLEKHFQLDLFSARPVGSADWSDMPWTQKAVALGIDLHEGALFGRATQIISTALAGTFMFIAAAGAMMWWKRRPQGRLDFSMPSKLSVVPAAMRAGLLLVSLLMPLAGLSIALLALRSKLRAPAPPA